MGNWPGASARAEPTHGCASIASNIPSAKVRMMACGVALGQGCLHGLGDDGVGGGRQQFTFSGDVPVDRPGAGGEPFGQGAKGQAAFSVMVQEGDRRLDDALSRKRSCPSLRIPGFFVHAVILTQVE